MNNFDLRKFLTENKLTSNTRLLKEDANLKSFDGQEGSFLGKVDYWNIYSLEGSSASDTMAYALVSSEEVEMVSIDVAGEEVSLDQIKQGIEGRGMSDEVAQFLLDDINSQL